MGVENVIFIFFFLLGTWLFARNAKKIIRNIRLGTATNRNDNPKDRWKTMALVAIGQSKMITRPVAGFFHVIIYAGFVIINIEVLEIIIDGIFGTHRVLAAPLGKVYNLLIGSFEILAALVLLACVVFLVRRNVIYIKRFHQNELNGWPRSDANLILVIEILLMTAFLFMNGADLALQKIGFGHYTAVGGFPISQYLQPLFDGLTVEAIVAIERGCWWFHILGIIAFLNYLPYSKHLHIILAFPNVYYSNLNKLGGFTNMESVTNEVKLMLDPSAIPPPVSDVPVKFGARDVMDLSWKNLLDAYTCTECGRCTSECPANQTGKLLSPRKIMMDTRDRLVEVGKNIDANKGIFVDDQKQLLHQYITPEELWACTTCNACVEACPVNIDPLAIIIDLRRYLVMEESNPPAALATMLSNIENNGAPWQFSQADRLNWASEN